MLVLTRKMNEQILIGDDIKITLVRVRGNTVRIGIEAPRDVRVLRGELTPDAGAVADADADEQPTILKRPSVATARVKSSAKCNKQDASSAPFPSTSRPSLGLSDTRQMFVGKVSRDGKSSELSRVAAPAAPLARFMSAP